MDYEKIMDERQKHVHENFSSTQYWAVKPVCES